jgi:AcrR family transcriptional regulator
LSPAKSKQKKPETTLNSAELKEHILKVARKHFAFKGLQGASLKEIAQEAQVAGSLLNYHFGDKQGLFTQCLESFVKDRSDGILRILGEPKSRDELLVRLQLFVEEMMANVLEDPYGFEIIDREMRSDNPEAIKLFESTLLMAFKGVMAFFTQAKENGLLKDDADPLVVSALLFSSTCDVVNSEHVAKRFFNLSFSDPKWRSHFAAQVVSLFTVGVIK